MKRVLASVSLGKEVTVSSHLFSEREEGLGRGVGHTTGAPFCIHSPEKWGMEAEVS